MGAFADSLFTLLLGWVRGVVGAIMTVISSGGESGILPFLGKNWLTIVLVILVVGLAGDWFIWMVRWQPYRVWGTNMRRVARALHIGARDQEDTQETAEEGVAPQDDAMTQTMLYQRDDAQAEENIDFAADAQDDFDLPSLTQEDEAQAYAAAEDVEDAQLGDYPGMRYDTSAYMRPEEPEASSEEEPTQEAAYEQPAYEEPFYEEASYEEPVYEEAGYEEPGYGQSDYEQPVYDEPAEDAPEAPVEYDNAQEPEEPQDVELAQEIDPLASYDDPRMLERMAQGTAEGSAGRRRRRHLGNSAAAQNTRLYSAVHASEPENH